MPPPTATLPESGIPQGFPLAQLVASSLSAVGRPLIISFKISELNWKVALIIFRILGIILYEIPRVYRRIVPCVSMRCIDSQNPQLSTTRRIVVGLVFLSSRWYPLLSSSLFASLSWSRRTVRIQSRSWIISSQLNDPYLWEALASDDEFKDSLPCFQYPSDNEYRCEDRG